MMVPREKTDNAHAIFFSAWGGGGGGVGGKQGVVGDAQMANFVSYNEDRGLANIKSVALF